MSYLRRKSFRLVNAISSHFMIPKLDIRIKPDIFINIEKGGGGMLFVFINSYTISGNLNSILYHFVDLFPHLDVFFAPLDENTFNVIQQSDEKVAIFLHILHCFLHLQPFTRRTFPEQNY